MDGRCISIAKSFNPLLNPPFKEFDNSLLCYASGKNQKLTLSKTLGVSVSKLPTIDDVMVIQEIKNKKVLTGVQILIIANLD